MRGKSEGSKNLLTKERFLENAVGKCPEVDIQIGGISFRCLLDTGSNVSTLTERFFRDHLHGEGEDMRTKWLRITAANKLGLRRVRHTSDGAHHSREWVLNNQR